MKKLIAILLALSLIFTVVGCGGAKETDKNTYTEGGVKISTEAFPEDTEIKVETVKEDNKKYETVKTALPLAVKINAYEITAESEGVKVQPDGTVQVTFPIPQSYDSAKHDIEVYYVADDGTTEKITAKLENDGVVAELKHFSTYVVILVERKTVTSSDTTTSSNATSSSAPSSTASSSSKPSSSKPSSSKPSSSTPSTPETVKAPTLNETKVKEMTEHFLWAGKYAHNVNGRQFTDFYNQNFQNLSDLTVLSFLYRYCNNDLEKYKTENEMGYVTTVPKSVLDTLAKRHLGYTYNFTKSYTEEDYIILIKYDSNSGNVIFTEMAGGFGDPDGFKFKSFAQSNDTVTVELIYHSYTEEKPSGVEGKDWDDVSEEDYICYVEYTSPSTLTFKYVDGNWRIMSFKSK